MHRVLVPSRKANKILVLGLVTGWYARDAQTNVAESRSRREVTEAGVELPSQQMSSIFPTPKLISPDPFIPLLSVLLSESSLNTKKSLSLYM